MSAAASSSNKHASRWRSFKFRRRNLELLRSEGLKLLFTALPRFVRFVFRVSMCSLKFCRRLVENSFFSRNLIKLKAQKKLRAHNLSRANSDQSLVMGSCCDKQSIIQKKSSMSEEFVFPSSLRKLTARELTRLQLYAKKENWENVLLLPNNEGVHGQDIFKLVHGQWLNSDLVNTYFSLLKLRCERLKYCLQAGFGNVTDDLMHCSHRSTHLSSYFFSSFWYNKYIQSGFAGVQSWTRDVDLRTFDCLFFPVNLNNLHWVLVVAYTDSRVVEYYNSMSSAHFEAVTSIVIEYLREVALHNNWVSTECKQWKPVDVSNHIPRQVDTSNCGVYMCVFTDLLSKGLRPPFCFSSEDIPSIRLGMAADFLEGSIS